MMKRLVVMCALVSGCGLYWGNNNGDDDDVCNVAKEPAQPEIRDPSTGICQANTTNPCGPCEPCGAATIEPDWPACSGICEGLDESDCLSTATCHAEYEQYVGPNQTMTGNQFVSCWDTLPGVQSTGDCTGLSDWTCADHDNCASLMISDDLGTSFSSCIAEPNACGPNTCGQGTHCAQECPNCPDTNAGTCTCVETCVPDTTCANTMCDPGEMCVTNCDALDGGCTPTCVPDGQNAGSCTGSVTCNSAAPACPSGTTAGIANGCYTGYCIPNADCGPENPGLCYSQVLCNIAPPDCPSGTLPGVEGNCYSGFCIPLGSCETPACETLSTEDACTARTDCAAVYTGTNCTCEAGSCTCQTLTFDDCVTAAIGL